MNTKIEINEALNNINTHVEAWRPRGKIDTKTGRSEIYNTPVKKKRLTRPTNRVWH